MHLSTTTSQQKKSRTGWQMSRGRKKRKKGVAASFYMLLWVIVIGNVGTYVMSIFGQRNKHHMKIHKTVHKLWYETYSRNNEKHYECNFFHVICKSYDFRIETFGRLGNISFQIFNMVEFPSPKKGKSQELMKEKWKGKKKM